MNTNHELVKLNLKASAETSRKLADLAEEVVNDKPMNVEIALAEIDLFASQVRGYVEAAKTNFKRAIGPKQKDPK